ncbi:MAG: hypothetical protein KAG43_04830 [Candidatus Marithrix sp.]|nr:hypothetical protein [Candidatus Marithrix sp.]
MSYILEAIRKDECERDIEQFVDYSGDEKIFPKKLAIVILLLLNVIVWSILLWPNESPESPQITITSPSPQSY